MIVPGVKIEGFVGAFIAAALIAILNAVLPPLIAALRLPYMLAVGFLLVLVLDAWMVKVAADLSDHTFEVDGFFSALLVALVAAAVTVVLEVLLGTNDDDVYSLRVTQRIARRSHASARDRRPRHHLPGDRRPRPAGAAARHPRRARARDGALARRRLAPALGVGDGPLVADRRLAGGAAARLQRRHPRLPLGGEGVGAHHDLLGAGRLRPHRGAALQRPRAAGRRRRQPQQPAVGRRRPGDPHRQPDGGREEGQPRLPGLPRRRLQRHAHVRALLLRGRSSSSPARRGSAGATCGRAATARSATRSCAPASPCSCATSPCTASSAT